MNPLNLSLPFVLATLFLLTGCATLSEDACRTGDWYGLGYRDGSAGRERSRLTRHQEACAEYAIQVDPSLYDKGYADGLGDYCTPNNGYRHGEQAWDYEGICPAALEHDYLEGYLAGLNAALQQSEMTLSDLRARYRHAEHQLFAEKDPKRIEGLRKELGSVADKMEDEREQRREILQLRNRARFLLSR